MEKVSKFDKERKSFGEFLAEKRNSAGLTQRAVAQSLGYSSAQSISNFERGMCQPPAGKAAAIIKLYGLTKREYATRILKIEEAKLRDILQ